MRALLVSFLFVISSVIGNGADYYYVNKLLSWSDARAYCQVQCDSDLVSIADATEFSNIRLNIPSRTSSTWVWIGLHYDGSSFVWSDQTPFNYTNWYSSITTDHKYCVEMTAHKNYEWETKNCSDSNTFICNSCHYDIADNSQSYHVNPNILSWDNSQLYCTNHCNSDLASIHNERDLNYAKYLSINGHKLNINEYSNNVSIGLFKNESSIEWEWIDGSDFNYGHDYRHPDGRPYPWSALLTNNSDAQCVRMKSSQNYEFHDGNCSGSAQSRFMCHSCDATLNKYVVVNIDKVHADGNAFCQRELGTALASLHSTSDHNEAKYLCQLSSNNSGDCHIGLSFYNSYQYDDGTGFDFGTELAAYPWSSYTSGDNVVLSQLDDYLWKAVDSTAKHNFICNLPSQLCTVSDWNVFGDWDAFETTNNCNLQHSNNGAAVMTDKQFINHNNELLIELIYAITDINSAFSSIAAGIMLFNMQSVCDYYYISITPQNNGKRSKLSLGKVNNGIYDILYMNDTMLFKIGVDYVLRVQVIDGDTFKVYINDNLMIEFTDFSSTVNGGVLSGYIGIMNRNLATIFRSLHVSGGEWIYDTVSLSTCLRSQYSTLSPTNEPTINPSLQPTFVPTNIPTNMPTNVPTFEPTKYPTTEPSYYPTAIPSLQPTSRPTVDPIELKSGSVDDVSSTTIIPDINNKDLDDIDDGALFLNIIYVAVAVIFCCLLSICVVMIYFNKKKQNVARYNVQYPQKDLELEQTKPDRISVKVTRKRELTTCTDDSIEGLYDADDLLGVDDTPITGTSLGNIDIFHDENDSDTMDGIYDKSTMENTKKEYKFINDDEMRFTSNYGEK